MRTVKEQTEWLMDDEVLNWIAEKVGKKLTPGQCNGIRSQMKDKIRQAIDKGFVPSCIGFDGYGVYGFYSKDKKWVKF